MAVIFMVDDPKKSMRIAVYKKDKDVFIATKQYYDKKIHEEAIDKPAFIRVASEYFGSEMVNLFVKKYYKEAEV